MVYNTVKLINNTILHGYNGNNGVDTVRITCDTYRNTILGKI